VCFKEIYVGGDVRSSMKTLHSLSYWTWRSILRVSLSFDQHSSKVPKRNCRATGI